MREPRIRSNAPEEGALEILTRALLLERSERCGDRELIAFLDGWSAALELMQKSDLLLPGAPAEIREAISACVERVRQAQYDALEEPAS